MDTALDLVNGAVKTGIKASARAISKEALEQTAKKGWKAGESITNLTAKGNVPKWSTVRQRHWKNKAISNNKVYDASNISRMQKGLAPQRINPTTGKFESM